MGRRQAIVDVLHGLPGLTGHGVHSGSDALPLILTEAIQ